MRKRMKDRVRREDKVKLLTHSSEVEKKGGMCPRGKPANEEELILIITSVIIISARALVLHPWLGILHEGIKTVATLLLWNLAETVKIQNFRRRRHWPVSHLI